MPGMDVACSIGMECFAMSPASRFCKAYLTENVFVYFPNSTIRVDRL